MKTLIVLSKQFPFGNKEQYIAHELGYLAQAFDRVIIYPSDHFKAGDRVTFSLPPNVEVVDLNVGLARVPKARVLLSFFSTYVREFFCFPRRDYMLRHFSRFRAIYVTQYAIGQTLLNFLIKSGIHPKDCVFYSYWMSASALSLSILTRRGEIPGYVSRAHSVDLYHEAWGLYDNPEIPPFRCFKQRMVHRIYSISRHGSEFLQSIGIEKQKVAVSYLGVDDFGLNPEKPLEVPVLVTCSGADANKRIHRLGESLARINRPVKWIHFGDGILKELALNSVKGSVVELDYRGNTPNHEIRTFYGNHHVDLFVMLSKVEGLPVSMMEAMSHGIPVLGTRVNGVPEIVNDQINGRLLPVDFTSDEVDEVLRDILTHIQSNSAWRVAARNMFCERFDASRNYTAFAHELRNLRFHGS
jgi:glycosyltransferase involved in cell wall biosynthesis